MNPTGSICSTSNLRIAGLSRDRDIPRYHGSYFQKHASNNPRSSTAAAPQLSLVIPSICFSFGPLWCANISKIQNFLAPKSRPKTQSCKGFFLLLSPFSDVRNILQCVDFAEPPGGYLCCWGVPAAESEPKRLSPCEVRLEGQFIILTRKPERTDFKKCGFIC